MNPRLLFYRRLRLGALARFADSMATCLAAGLPPARSLWLSRTTVNAPSFHRMVEEAVEVCGEGLPISEALIPAGRSLPNFFLPLIAAGELSGHQVEAFRLVENYCRRLGPAMEAVRKAWLFPLIGVLVGWTARLTLYIGFGLYVQAGQFLRDTAGTVLVLGLAGWLVGRIPLVKTMLDRLRLEIPVVREVEIALSLSLFLSVFRLLYSAGGMDVISMLNHALETVRNSVVRRDLLQVRTVVEQDGGLDDAFLKPSLLPPNLSGIIAASAVAGRLDEGLERAAAQALATLESSLEVFNRIAFRVVSFSVATSIAGTILVCLSYSGR
ncbi:MAG TPA: type II secretion system F family protein [Verrucomicrobiota bacterium]|nr:hypothetical protein [Verrucomicrobiales bacterium]HRI14533.1 type II secretion system F family protein [Verrucomicrobiota bacterium]